VVAQPDEKHANRTASALEWYGRYRAYNIWFKLRTMNGNKNNPILALKTTRAGIILSQ